MKILYFDEVSALVYAGSLLSWVAGLVDLGLFVGVAMASFDLELQCATLHLVGHFGAMVAPNPVLFGATMLCTKRYKKVIDWFAKTAVIANFCHFQCSTS